MCVCARGDERRDREGDTGRGRGRERKERVQVCRNDRNEYILYNVEREGETRLYEARLGKRIRKTATRVS